MNFVFVRHTSVNVPKGYCYGQTDVPLAESFEQEAREVKSRLTRRSFARVFTSPLSRCTRLATYCGYPHAIRDRRLLELDFGDWEMQPFDRIMDPNLQEWFADYLHVPATHGESFMQQYQRVADFIDGVRRSHLDTVLVFTHGGVLLCAQKYAGQISDTDLFAHTTPYGGMVELTL